MPSKREVPGLEAAVHGDAACTAQRPRKGHANTEPGSRGLAPPGGGSAGAPRVPADSYTRPGPLPSLQSFGRSADVAGMEKPKPRILVVDDEAPAIDLLKRSLRKEGTVSAAGSGEEAWSLLEQQGFDLVISDQRMPGISGVELLERAAELDDHVGRVLLTGYSDLEATVDAINRGRVHAYLHKPIAVQQLIAVVRGVLERVGLVREKLRLLAVVSQQRDRLREALSAVQARWSSRRTPSNRPSRISPNPAERRHRVGGTRGPPFAGSRREERGSARRRATP